MMPKISAIIVITENPPYALKTIEAINPFVDEIIVGTIRINQQLLSAINQNSKISVIELPSDIPYADLIKEDLKKKAKHPYILYLDPDEIIPNKVWKVIEQNLDRFDCFYFPRKNIIFSKWIQYSRWWPDYQLRFFKKEKVIWPKQIHPIPKCTGMEFKIPAEEVYAIVHHNYDNIDEYLEKSRRYAKSEALTYLNEKKDLKLSDTIGKSLSEFISRFFANEGYRDSSHGFALAILQMFYYILVHLYYWENKKYYYDKPERLLRSTLAFFREGTQASYYWLIRKHYIVGIEKYKIKLMGKLSKLLGI